MPGAIISPRNAQAAWRSAKMLLANFRASSSRSHRVRRLDEPASLLELRSRVRARNTSFSDPPADAEQLDAVGAPGVRVSRRRGAQSAQRAAADFWGCAQLRNAQAAPQRGEVNVTVFLPHAADGWSDWEAAAQYAGSQNASRAYGLASIPLYVRRGAVLPLRRWLGRAAASGRLNDAVAASLLWTVWPASTGVSSSGLLIEDNGVDLSTDTAESRVVVTHGDAATVAVLSAVRGSYSGMAAARSVSLAFRGVRRLPQSVTVGGDALEALANPPAALGQRGFALLSGEQAVEVPEGPLVLPPGTLLMALGAVRVSEEVRVVVVW